MNFFFLNEIIWDNLQTKNTFKNTSEDQLNTFCDIISRITSKYPDFLGPQKLPDRTVILVSIDILISVNAGNILSYKYEK